MPRVNRQKKNKAGREISCSRCGAKIEPGQQYFKWSFRYGGTYTNCELHYPKQSELTQSKLSEVYAAVEDAQEEIRNADEISGISDAVSAVAETVGEVADEYREAAEPFGGEGENAERADELEGWQSELENFYPDDSAEIEATQDEADELISGCPL